MVTALEMKHATTWSTQIITPGKGYKKGQKFTIKRLSGVNGGS